MRKFVKTMLAAAVCVACSVGVAQAKTYKFATNFPSDGAPGLLLNEFAQNVAERTEDRVKIKFFWNCTLGGQGQYLQQIKSGVVDMGVVNSAELENIAPELAAVNMPYVFPSTEVYAQCFADPTVKSMMQGYVADKGLVLAGYLNNATRDIYATKEMKSIADLKGMKIRTNASDTYIKMFAAIDAIATPTDYSEVFAGLQQGLIDGAEGGLAALYEMNFAQVAKYGLRTGHSRLTDFIVISTRVEKKMGDEDYKIVLDEFQKISDKSMISVDAHMEKAIKKAIDEKGAIIHECDTTPFQKAVEPMYKEAAQDPVKKPLLEAIFKVQGRTI